MINNEYIENQKEIKISLNNGNELKNIIIDDTETRIIFQTKI